MTLIGARRLRRFNFQFHRARSGYIWEGPELRALKRRKRRAPLIIAIFFALFVTVTFASPKLIDLKAYPPSINLSSARDRQQIVIQATYDDDTTKDVTTSAALKLSDPAISQIGRASCRERV